MCCKAMDNVMRIIGHGIDVVQVADIEALLNRISIDSVLLDWLTVDEQTNMPPDDGNKAAHLAGQLAAKEAVSKALGTGLFGDMLWTDIEVLREESGRPYVLLHGAVAEAAAQLGVNELSVSTTHTSVVAVASAIAVGD